MNGEAGRLWDTTTLGVACEINPAKPKLAELADDTPIMFVPMASVDDVTGTVAAPKQRRLGEVRSKSYRTFGPQDVIFAKITPCMENGKCAVVPDIPSGLGFGSTEFHVLRPRSGVNPRFIWHYVRQESFRRVAEDHMTGSVGQLRVPSAFLHDFPLRLPPRAIQDEIVRALDTSSAKARSAVTHLAAARRTIQRFRQAVLATACSGRLTADWREQHPSVESADRLLDRIATTRTSPRTGAPRAIAEPASVGEIPSSWRWVEFGSVIGELRNGISPAPSMEPPGVPILRISAVRPLGVDLEDIRFLREPLDKWAQHRLQDGDLLFTRYNGSLALLGVCGMVRGLDGRDMLYPDKLMRVRFDHTCISPEYVEMFFSSPLARERMMSAGKTSAGQQGVSGASVKAQALAVPPLAEQNEIVHRASRMLALANGLLTRVEAASQRAERSSQAVLGKAFRGELLAIDSELGAAEATRS